MENLWLLLKYFSSPKIYSQILHVHRVEHSAIRSWTLRKWDRLARLIRWGSLTLWKLNCITGGQNAWGGLPPRGCYPEPFSSCFDSPKHQNQKLFCSLHIKVINHIWTLIEDLPCKHLCNKFTMYIITACSPRINQSLHALIANIRLVSIEPPCTKMYNDRFECVKYRESRPPSKQIFFVPDLLYGFFLKILHCSLLPYPLQKPYWCSSPRVSTQIRVGYIPMILKPLPRPVLFSVRACEPGSNGLLCNFLV